MTKRTIDEPFAELMVRLPNGALLPKTVFDETYRQTKQQRKDGYAFPNRTMRRRMRKAKA